ncbi:hypothetical protein C2E23DRAFT_906717 [Lenzites betulinus]|nr:hypothetical protein C2E23DRAFT_906717 [Lenzites betulinus]
MKKTSVDAALRFCISALKEDAECLLANAALGTIELYKQIKNRAEHEYLLLTIVNKTTHLSFAGPPLGLIKIDRTYDHADGNQVFAAASSSSISSSSIKDAPASIPANDALILFPTTPSDHKGVISVSFTLENAPSWLDVLVAAKAVHKHSPDYILLSPQCYWYAAMVMRVLIGDQDPRILASAQSTEFEVAFDPTPTSGRTPRTVVPGREGTFKSIFRLVTAQDIDDLYDKEVKDVYLALHLETHENLRQAAAARQAVEQRAVTAEQTAAKERAAAAKERAARATAEQARATAEEANALLREQLAQLRLSHTPAHGTN